MGKSVDVGQTVHAKLKAEVTITFGRDDTAARGIPFLLYF
jgi:NAD(P)H-hydrate repair Nnr-like enzyme with NAD(P)H-hydrate epimerase domain